MNEAIFEKKLADLIEELQRLPVPPDSRVVAFSRRGKDYQEKLTKSVESMQDSLDFLRISVKYLLFDLEATRRENAYLRRLTDDRE